MENNRNMLKTDINKILNEDINHFYDDTWNKKILEEKKSKRQTKDFTGSLKIMQIYI